MKLNLIGSNFEWMGNANSIAIHEDSLKVLKILEDNSVDLIFADPPYGLGKDFGKQNPDSFQSAQDYLSWAKEWVDECMRVLKPNGTMYFMCSVQNMPLLDVYISERYFIINRLIWTYDSSGIQSKKRFGSLYEPILMITHSAKSEYTFNAEDIMVETSTGSKRKLIDYRKTPPQPYNDKKVPGNVWNFNRVRFRMDEYENHPTQKPEALLERIILASSNPGDVVLDPFAGSFTASSVACRHGRVAIGIESNEDYYRIGLRRTGITDNYKGEELVKDRSRKTNNKAKADHLPLLYKELTKLAKSNPEIDIDVDNLDLTTINLSRVRINKLSTEELKALLLTAKRKTLSNQEEVSNVAKEAGKEESNASVQGSSVSSTLASRPAAKSVSLADDLFSNQEGKKAPSTVSLDTPQSNQGNSFSPQEVDKVMPSKTEELPISVIFPDLFPAEENREEVSSEQENREKVTESRGSSSAQNKKDLEDDVSDHQSSPIVQHSRSSSRRLGAAAPETIEDLAADLNTFLANARRNQEAYLKGKTSSLLKSANDSSTETNKAQKSLKELVKELEVLLPPVAPSERGATHVSLNPVTSSTANAQALAKARANTIFEKHAQLKIRKNSTLTFDKGTESILLLAEELVNLKSSEKANRKEQLAIFTAQAIIDKVVALQEAAKKSNLEVGALEGQNRLALFSQVELKTSTSAKAYPVKTKVLVEESSTYTESSLSSLAKSENSPPTKTTADLIREFTEVNHGENFAQENTDGFLVEAFENKTNTGKTNKGKTTSGGGKRGSAKVAKEEQAPVNLLDSLSNLENEVTNDSLVDSKESVIESEEDLVQLTNEQTIDAKKGKTKEGSVEKYLPEDSSADKASVKSKRGRKPGSKNKTNKKKGKDSSLSDSLLFVPSKEAYLTNYQQSIKDREDLVEILLETVENFSEQLPDKVFVSPEHRTNHFKKTIIRPRYLIDYPGKRGRKPTGGNFIYNSDGTIETPSGFLVRTDGSVYYPTKKGRRRGNKETAFLNLLIEQERMFSAEEVEAMYQELQLQEDVRTMYKKLMKK